MLRPDLGQCQSVTEGKHDQRQSIGHIELAEYRRQVVPDRDVRDRQPPGNLLVLEAFPDQAHDLALTLGQRSDSAAGFADELQGLTIGNQAGQRRACQRVPADQQEADRGARGIMVFHPVGNKPTIP